MSTKFRIMMTEAFLVSESEIKQNNYYPAVNFHCTHPSQFTDYLLASSLAALLAVAVGVVEAVIINISCVLTRHSLYT